MVLQLVRRIGVLRISGHLYKGLCGVSVEAVEIERVRLPFSVDFES